MEYTIVHQQLRLMVTHNNSAWVIRHVLWIFITYCLKYELKIVNKIGTSYLLAERIPEQK